MNEAQKLDGFFMLCSPWLQYGKLQAALWRGMGCTHRPYNRRVLSVPSVRLNRICKYPEPADLISIVNINDEGARYFRNPISKYVAGIAVSNNLLRYRLRGSSCSANPGLKQIDRGRRCRCAKLLDVDRLRQT